MSDAATLVTLAGTGFASVGIVAGAALHGWSKWLELKKVELSATSEEERRAAPAASRIELADLKERVRRLEAIASGVDY